MPPVTMGSEPSLERWSISRAPVLAAPGPSPAPEEGVPRMGLARSVAREAAAMGSLAMLSTSLSMKALPMEAASPPVAPRELSLCCTFFRYMRYFCTGSGEGDGERVSRGSMDGHGVGRERLPPPRPPGCV